MFDLKLSDAEIEELKSPTYNFDEQLSRIETLVNYTVTDEDSSQIIKWSGRSLTLKEMNM